MQVQSFNSTPIVHKKPRRDFANSPLAEGCLDPGFEDLGGKSDVMIAAGVMAHFGNLDAPPTDYCALPVLERVALDL